MRSRVAAFAVSGVLFCVLPPAADAMETVVYKAIDAQGRVTYANAPIKGGVRVELQPLTIIPSSPTGSLGDANSGVPSKEAQRNRAVARVEPQGASTKPGSSATLPSVDRHSTPPVPAAATNVPATAAALSGGTSTAEAAPAGWSVKAEPAPSGGTLSPAAQQRRDELRRRMVETELSTEQAALAEARESLKIEQRRAGAMRTMHASMGGAVTAESRRAIEKLFERIRQLQDQIATHEEMVAYLAGQLPGGQTSALASRASSAADMAISVR